MTSSELAIRRVELLYAPDDRTVCFEVDQRTVDGELVLEGTVQTEQLRRAVSEAFERRYGPDAVREEIAVLEPIGESATIDSPIAPVRSAPDGDTEQVTKTLYGAAITAYDRRDGWRRIRTPDGYVGWIESPHLSSVPTADDAEGRADLERRTGARRRSDLEWRPDAVLTEASVPVVATQDTDEMPPERLYAGTDCRIEAVDGDRTTVSFRTGAVGTIRSEAVRSLGSTVADRTIGSGEDVVSIARQFLGTPYEWGGMSVDGIDCSGLVWIAYACVGVTLPRDADQQERMGAEIDRSALRPGDLLFFPGHVAISLGGTEYVHAYGSAEQVQINSLDPDDDRYIADLETSVRSTRRIL